MKRLDILNEVLRKWKTDVLDDLIVYSPEAGMIVMGMCDCGDSAIQFDLNTNICEGIPIIEVCRFDQKYSDRRLITRQELERLLQ